MIESEDFHLKYAYLLLFRSLHQQAIEVKIVRCCQDVFHSCVNKSYAN